MIHDTKEADFRVMKISSPSFEENSFIPAKHTCDGENVSPVLNVADIPEEAKSLAIIADDPDAPNGTWVHWVIWNMPVTHHIKENDAHGVNGVNDFHKNMYNGPCPPKGTHRYFFKVYALDDTFELRETSTKSDLERAMSDHIIAFGELVGLYKRR